MKHKTNALPSFSVTRLLNTTWQRAISVVTAIALLIGLATVVAPSATAALWHDAADSSVAGAPYDGHHYPAVDSHEFESAVTQDISAEELPMADAATQPEAATQSDTAGESDAISSSGEVAITEAGLNSGAGGAEAVDHAIQRFAPEGVHEDGLVFDTRTGQLTSDGVPLLNHSEAGHWAYDAATRTLTFDSLTWETVDSWGLQIVGGDALAINLYGVNRFVGDEGGISVGDHASSFLVASISGPGDVQATSRWGDGFVIAHAHVTLRSGTVIAQGPWGVGLLNGTLAILGGTLSAQATLVTGIFGWGNNLHFYGGTLEASGWFGEESWEPAVENQLIDVRAVEYQWQAGDGPGTPIHTFPPTAFTPDGSRYVKLVAPEQDAITPVSPPVVEPEIPELPLPPTSPVDPARPFSLNVQASGMAGGPGWSGNVWGSAHSSWAFPVGTEFEFTWRADGEILASETVTMLESAHHVSASVGGIDTLYLTQVITLTVTATAPNGDTETATARHMFAGPVTILGDGVTVTGPDAVGRSLEAQLQGWELPQGFTKTVTWRDALTNRVLGEGVTLTVTEQMLDTEVLANFLFFDQFGEQVGLGMGAFHTIWGGTTGTVAIGGIPEVGRTLTAVVTGFEDAESLEFTWWIGNQVYTGESVYLSPETIGRQIFLEATARRGSVTMRASDRVQIPMGRVEITGPGTVGSLLEVALDGWVLPQGWAMGVEWRGHNILNDWNSIVLDTGPTLEVTEAMIDRTVVASVTIADQQGLVVGHQFAQRPLWGGVIGSVEVTGTPSIGYVLVADASSFIDADWIHYSWSLPPASPEEGWEWLGSGATLQVPPQAAGRTIELQVNVWRAQGNVRLDRFKHIQIDIPEREVAFTGTTPLALTGIPAPGGLLELPRGLWEMFDDHMVQAVITWLTMTEGGEILPLQIETYQFSGIRDPRQFWALDDSLLNQPVWAEIEFTGRGVWPITIESEKVLINADGEWMAVPPEIIAPPVTVPSVPPMPLPTVPVVPPVVIEPAPMPEVDVLPVPRPEVTDFGFWTGEGSATATINIASDLFRGLFLDDTPVIVSEAVEFDPEVTTLELSPEFLAGLEPGAYQFVAHFASRVPQVPVTLIVVAPAPLPEIDVLPVPVPEIVNFGFWTGTGDVSATVGIASDLFRGLFPTLIAPSGPDGPLDVQVTGDASSTVLTLSSEVLAELGIGTHQLEARFASRVPSVRLTVAIVAVQPMPNLPVLPVPVPGVTDFGIWGGVGSATATVTIDPDLFRGLYLNDTLVLQRDDVATDSQDTVLILDAKFLSTLTHGLHKFEARFAGRVPSVPVNLNVIVPNPMPEVSVIPAPVADAGDNLVVFVDTEIPFDAGNSTPLEHLTEFSWDFGDGATAIGQQVTHSFTTAGVFEVTLQVTAETGRTDSATVEVTVVQPQIRQGLEVTVRRGNSLLAGAEAVVLLPDGARVSGTTDGSGLVVLPSIPDGEIAVFVWANGFMPVSAPATVVDGFGEVSVNLTTGSVGEAQIEHRPLSYDEIIAAGIDPDAAENNHFYEAYIVGAFTPGGTSLGIVQVPRVPSGGGTYGPFQVWVGCETECRTWATLGGSSGGPSGTSSPGRAFPSATWVNGELIIQWLVVPMGASWLREFFEVSLIVSNLATGPFTFQNGTAELQVPAGLSLAPLVGNPQNARVALADIPAGGSEIATWILRGDVEGFYDLTANYRAIMPPFGEIELLAATREPLRVWGGSALETSITFTCQANTWAPLNLYITMRNVSDTNVYNLSVWLGEFTDDLPDGLLPDGAEPNQYIFAPEVVNPQSRAVLAPSEVVTFEFTLYTDLDNNMVFSHQLSSIVRSGGNIDLAPEIAPCIPRVAVPQRLDVEWERRPATCPWVASSKFGCVEDQEWEPGLVVSWAEDQISASVIRVYVRDTMDASSTWRFVGSLPGHMTEFFIPSDETAGLGQFFALVSEEFDGTLRHVHRIGVGPSGLSDQQGQ